MSRIPPGRCKEIFSKRTGELRIDPLGGQLTEASRETNRHSHESRNVYRCKGQGISDNIGISECVTDRVQRTQLGTEESRQFVRVVEISVLGFSGSPDKDSPSLLIVL